MTASACSTVVVGRKASTTGHVIVGHAEDDGGNLRFAHAIVPARDWPADACVPELPERAAVPQVPHTCRFWWSEVREPELGVSCADAFYNEHGVWVVSNFGGLTRPGDELRADDLTDGGLGYAVRRAVAERATSARHAVDVIAGLVARWGYVDASRVYTVADRDEAWSVQILHGCHFAARRCPDDGVLFVPNHLTIRALPETPTADAVFSPDLWSWAAARGWWKSGQPRDFARVFLADRWREIPHNTVRRRYMLSLLLGREPTEADFGFSVTCPKPLSPEDVARVMTAHPDGVPRHVKDSDGPSVCRGSTVETTVCAFGAKPEDARLHLGRHPACEAGFKTFRPLVDAREAGFEDGDGARRLDEHFVDLTHASAAEWISGDTKDPAKPAPVLMRAFVLDKVPGRALLELSVAGWHEVSMNGRRVGDAVLSPVTCQPDMRQSFVVHDVAAFLKPGTNVLEVVLGNGWFNCFTKGAWGFENERWLAAPRIRGRFVADTTTLFETDASWQAYDSPIVFNALRNGEWYDARREGRRFNLRRAKIETPPPGEVVSREDAAPCRAFDPIAPVRDFAAADGSRIYDFGSNRAGWCEIEVVGEAGAKVTLDYDEALAPGGTNLLGHVNCYALEHHEPRPCQHDEYVLAGRAGGETWHPRFTYHGFRYVKVSKTGKVALKAIRSVFVHSDFRSVGSLSISDPTFAKLQDAFRRSYLSNFTGIPTDCPHREKNGWTGDAQLSVESGLWNFDAQNGYRHFLRMIVDAQHPDGSLSCIAPASASFGYGWAGPAWDAVLFEIPWQLYRFSGDDAAAREAYPAMKKYLGFMATKQHVDGLVDYGLGDWCAPEGFVVATNLLTDSAYVYEFNRRTAFWAERFGEKRVADRCRAEAARIRTAFNRTFYKGGGVYGDGQLTALAAPLYFPGLVADGAEAATVAELLKRVRAKRHQAWFGILGAKWVPRVLAAHGHVDDAYRLFVQPDFPGWAKWVANGEDTLWEHWEGHYSHNHVMFGDFSAWAFEYLAGIKTVGPGFGKVDVKPHLPEGVASFDVSCRTPQGKTIRVTARRDANGQPVYEVVR